MREMAGLDEGTPLFAQVAERLAADIADGGLAEGERVPSTNELAAFYRINPATAAKGINILADEGTAGQAPRHRDVRGRRGACDASWPAGGPGFHRAVRGAAAYRGDPARDRLR